MIDRWSLLRVIILPLVLTAASRHNIRGRREKEESHSYYNDLKETIANATSMSAQRVLSLFQNSGVADDSPEATARIVGGSWAIRGRHPYFVMPGVNWWGCAGTVIDKEWVLTAAHCTDDWQQGQKSNAYIGAVGYDHWNAKATHYLEHREWKTYYVHPRYKKASWENDLALIQLSTPTNVHPIKMDTGFLSFTSGVTTLTTLGYGTTKEGQKSINMPETMKEVDLPYIPNGQCEKLLGTGRVTPDMMCAGGELGNDACTGDSGGPIIKKGRVPSEDVLVGCVSWGRGCGRKNHPGVYARTSVNFWWIKQTMCSNSRLGTPELCDTPTDRPTRFPTQHPTRFPTQHPTKFPTQRPTDAPTQFPTKYPTQYPTKYPTQFPTKYPTQFPTKYPTQLPTEEPAPEKIKVSPSAQLAQSTPTPTPTPNPIVSKIKLSPSAIASGIVPAITPTSTIKTTPVDPIAPSATPAEDHVLNLSLKGVASKRARGAMFQITALKDIVLNNLELNVPSTADDTVVVFTTPGSFSEKTKSAAGWDMFCKPEIVQAEEEKTLVALTGCEALTLNQGEVRSFFTYWQTQPNVIYSVADPSEVEAGNADIELNAGRGMGGYFGGNEYNPRIISGRLNYLVPEPPEIPEIAKKPEIAWTGRYLKTPFERGFVNNGADPIRGVMFSIKALNKSVKIERLDLHLQDGRNTISIFFKKGLYRRSEEDASDWEKAFSGAVYGKGRGNSARAVPFQTPFSLEAGEYISFYVFISSGKQFCSPQKESYGLPQNNDIAIIAGEAQKWPFRHDPSIYCGWNGIVQYDAQT